MRSFFLKLCGCFEVEGSASEALARHCHVNPGADGVTAGIIVTGSVAALHRQPGRVNAVA